MRPAYAGLHFNDNVPYVVLGRKFCAGCGHWRHVCDFARYRSGRPRSRCRVCVRVYNRNWFAQATDDQIARRNEYSRIRLDAERRQRGAPVRPWRHQPLPVERVLLPTGPILAVLDDAGETDADIAALAGVSARLIYRLRVGESAHVSLDAADRLTTALGIPLALVYPGSDLAV